MITDGTRACAATNIVWRGIKQSLMKRRFWKQFAAQQCGANAGSNRQEATPGDAW